jgi:RNA polymerase sigma factor (sigma-70 family)
MSPSRNALNSAQLLQRAQAGDGSALTSLLGLYLPRLRRWAHGRLPPRARDALDTEDIVQDTIVAAVRNLHRVEIRGEGALQAYLRKALANRFADLYRRHEGHLVRQAIDTQLPAFTPSPLEVAIGRQALDRYEQALDSLSERDRHAVILRIEMCAEYSEISVALDASGVEHARVIVSRALARLAQEMRRGRV